MKILVVIPARGGSKGIPRKNLRALAGKPLLYYSIQNALKIEGDVDVVVSSEDEEILFFAEKFGASAYKRSIENADDVTTLDPVIYEAYCQAKSAKGHDYELIVTMQATSPLLEVESVQKGITHLIHNPKTDTVISCMNDTHLSWGNDSNGGFKPLYAERLNRQYLPPSYKETGGFLITRNSIITENNRIGPKVELIELAEKEAIDIDTFADWNLCEYYLQHKTIVFSLTGNNVVGLGHVYNCLTLANQILNHRLIFILDKDSQLGVEKIKENNYEVYIQKSESIAEDILSFAPDLVINDCLDTSAKYMKSLKQSNVKVLNIEDLGEGINFADTVVNAIYPEKGRAKENHFFGPSYFAIRDEFYLAKPIVIKPSVNRVFIAFGGVDPNNLTQKTLEAIYDYCIENKIQITVVVGLGYTLVDNLRKFSSIILHQNVKSISDLMLDADIAFTSAGRTTYELACLGVPAIVMSQNERETTHFFAEEKNGFRNLGLGAEVDGNEILDCLKQLISDFDRREDMQIKMLRNDIRSGRDRVIQEILKLI